MTITPADILAAADVLQQAAKEAEGTGAAMAIPLLEALDQLDMQAKAARSELKTQAIRGLEQPLMLGNRVWRKVPSIKKRPEQERIANMVKKLAATPDPNTGELHAIESVDRAVAIMSALYVSPSAIPKAGGLRILGVYIDDVSNEENTGYDLAFVEIPT